MSGLPNSNASQKRGRDEEKRSRDEEKFRQIRRERRDALIAQLKTTIPDELGNLSIIDLEQLASYFSYKKEWSQIKRGMSYAERMAMSSRAMIVIAGTPLTRKICGDINLIDTIIANTETNVTEKMQDLKIDEETLLNVVRESRAFVKKLDDVTTALDTFKGDAIDKNFLTSGRLVREHKERKAKLDRAAELGLDISAPNLLELLADKEAEIAREAKERAEADKKAKQEAAEADKKARREAAEREKTERFEANKALALKHGLDVVGKEYAEVRDMVRPIKAMYQKISAAGLKPDDMSAEDITATMARLENGESVSVDQNATSGSEAKEPVKPAKPGKK